MKKSCSNKGAKILVGMALLLGATAAPAWAVFSLDVTPLRGGRDIGFDTVREGRTVPNEEVRFTITSDQSKRYQVSQALASPLMNERGDIFPSENIKLFSASNVLGTLKPVLVTSLRMGTDVLYTSNAQGASDEFVLVFALQPAADTPAGIYQSQMIYTLEAVEGGVSPVTVVRNIRVEITGDFGITVKNERGGRSLDMGKAMMKGNLKGEGTLIYQITSNTGVPYRILHGLAGPLIDPAGGEIAPEKIQFRTLEGSMGALSQTPRMLVSSDSGGTKTLEVQYWVDASNASAGVYEGTLNIQVESGTGAVKNLNLPVRLEVETLFCLDIAYEGGNALNFGNFDEKSGPKTRTVVIHVLNNRYKKYQVSQVVSGPMTNQEGKIIEPENFTFSVKSPSTNDFIASAPRSVAQGDTVIFISDDQGTPAELRVEYQLEVPIDQRGGQYLNKITFSISSI